MRQKEREKKISKNQNQKQKTHQNRKNSLNQIDYKHNSIQFMRIYQNVAELISEY